MPLGEAETTVVADAELETLIDNVLKEADLNNDGYVTYAEFKAYETK